ncbi:MAG: HEPN domain-containing protein [Flavobacteriaceae bacterium]
MRSFRTEIEDPIVEQDILELERKIFAFKEGKMDEEKFRSLRLARGVYGQRQEGVQMVRIKIPYGKCTAKQLRRIAKVSDEYSNGNLHITTRQDIQIHYVSLDRTPELWAELEQDDITMREACGNTIRNVTASPLAGVDPNEPFDVTPYAHAFFEYFLRNPICQDMGRKIKIAFSSSEKDDALTFTHDIGFIPQIKDGKRGFKMLVGGGIGAQPRVADVIHEFISVEEFIPFTEAVVRVFDQYGERNRRNKARMKFLIKEQGFETFLERVLDVYQSISPKKIEISTAVLEQKNTANFEASSAVDVQYTAWKTSNVMAQKQEGLVAVGIAIDRGDISSDKARALAEVVEAFCSDDLRFTIGQSILLRGVKKDNLPALYLALQELGLAKVGFHKINDIVACPGTDTCNLGIASSMGLAAELQRIIEEEYPEVIEKHQLSIKISGCMNACGQHAIADIGFQGMTVKSNGNIAPATQVLLGGGILGNGEGRYADKALKVPAKRTPQVLRWLLKDFDANVHHEETFLQYYLRKETDYFYQNLKEYAEVSNLTDEDFVDWGNEEVYEKAIGVGECAGVTIDLVQTLLFDAEEQLEKAKEALAAQSWANSVYYSYAGSIRAAKALLTTRAAKINSHHSIIDAFETHFPTYQSISGKTFGEIVRLLNTTSPSEDFTHYYFDEAVHVMNWIKDFRHAQQN